MKICQPKSGRYRQNPEFKMTKHYLIFFLFLNLLIVGQNKTATMEIVDFKTDKYQGDDSIYIAVDKSAEYPGGISAMKKYISNKQKLSDTAKVKGCVLKFTGTVFVKCIVEKNGSLNDINVLKGINNCKACDDEAINIVKSMPKWTPAMLNGKTVKSYFNIPVTYRQN